MSNNDIDKMSIKSNVDNNNSVTSSNNNDDCYDDIKLPILKYGYITKKLQWDDLYNIIMVQKNLAKVSRSIEQQKEYEIYKYKLLKQWCTVYDYILCTHFNTIFQKHLDNNINKTYAYPLLKDNKIIKTSLVKNDFPYYMENNIEHYILWKIGDVCNTEDIIEAKKTLQQMYNTNTAADNTNNDIEFIHWINTIELKSIPEIDHLHILVKKTK